MLLNQRQARKLTLNQRRSTIAKAIQRLTKTKFYTNLKRRSFLEYFNYRDGELFVEDLSISQISDSVGTPFYCYSQSSIEQSYQQLASAIEGLNLSIYYAIKASSNPAIIKVLADQGAGADIVSGGELRLALAAGLSADRIVFAGVGKTREEMAFALSQGILQFNVESPQEIEVLNSVAEELGLIAPIALRINPDVDAKTDARITTGKADNKFGIDAKDALTLAERSKSLKSIRIDGLAVHIGSQLLDLEPYREAYNRLGSLATSFMNAGFGLRHLDLGGGVGIAYDLGQAPDLNAYAAIVKDTVHPLGLPLMMEPGRSLVGQSGLMVSKVIHTKDATTKSFAIIDAAMNDLIRPALYQAKHTIRPVKESTSASHNRSYDFVGPVCESTDTFAEDFDFSELEADDLVAFYSAGAYGAVMASEYNGRPLIPEVLVKGDRYAVIRQRPSYEDMLKLYSLASWQK
jgi:diaminopimelate decarboxylase